jgi:hypothetical protein
VEIEDLVVQVKNKNMRELEEILSELRHVTEWSRPNIAFETTMNLINEIEATYTQPTQPVEVVDVVVEKVEEIEETPQIPDDVEFTIEDMVEPTLLIEEVVVEPVATAKPVVEKVIGRKPRKK